MMQSGAVWTGLNDGLFSVAQQQTYLKLHCIGPSVVAGTCPDNRALPAEDFMMNGLRKN